MTVSIESTAWSDGSEQCEIASSSMRRRRAAYDGVERATTVSMQETVQRYQRHTKDVQSNNALLLEHNMQHLKDEAADMSKKIELLEAAKRKLLGECLGSCTIKELQQIEQQLERSVSTVRARKMQVFQEHIAQLKEKLGGKRVGIIGLGSIGLEVAKRLDAFGCTISYNSKKKKPHVGFPFYHNVLDLATNCNVLVICCALTDQTHHMINKEVLLALGKKGIVINIARGSVIDEKELVQCLVRGEIAGAGLDVFENEPEVPKELFELDNVVMSPHRAVFTEESFNDLCELMAGNLEAFFSNKPLLSPVD